jgi:hypothetical protein
VEAVKTLLRLFSFLFHGLLALLLFAVSAFALASGAPSLQLGMLPWNGTTLDYALLLGAVVGLVSLVLAIQRKLRFLFLLWSLAVAVLLVRGYIFSPYHFESGGVRTALYLMFGSLLAILGAWFQMFVPIRRSKGY